MTNSYIKDIEDILSDTVANLHKLERNVCYSMKVTDQLIALIRTLEDILLEDEKRNIRANMDIDALIELVTQTSGK